jgi:transcriptional regulator with XRE-family HTH domain
MFYERLKVLRESNNLTQVQLAKKLNVSKQSVSNWENNNILPSIDVLIRTAQFFQVSTDYMLGLTDRKYIEVSNLTLEELAHVQQIIKDINKDRR